LLLLVSIMAIFSSFIVFIWLFCLQILVYLMQFHATRRFTQSQIPGLTRALSYLAL
jgi:hypothetical protein